MQNRSAIWLFTILLTLACLFSLSYTFFTSKFEKVAREEAVYPVDSIKELRELSASEEGQLLEEYETKYIKKHGNDPIFPILGYSYYECKDRELGLGLDLEGGMSAVVELSIAELVKSLAGNPDEEFHDAIRKAKDLQKTSEDDFITLFSNVWESEYPNKQMIAVFHSMDTKDKFPLNLTDNAAVVDVLRGEAEAAISNTENIIQARIDKFGVTQPNIQKQQFSGRILVELPGVKDKERVRKLLKSTANLEFWKTYSFSDYSSAIGQANEALSKALYPNLGIDEEVESDTSNVVIDGEESLIDTASNEVDTTLTEVEDELEDLSKRAPLWGTLLQTSSIENGQPRGIGKSVWGFALATDTAKVNKYLKHPAVTPFFPSSSNIKFLWGSKEYDDGLIPLHAIKIESRDGKPALEGSVIIDANQDFEQFTNEVIVNMRMDSEGAKEWSRITEEAANNNKAAVAIVMDNDVYSAPSVNEKIPNGSSRIGVGGGTRDDQMREASDLANLLKAGALPAPAEIVDEQVVGSTIGSTNINKGLNSFLIALVLILIYMVLYYKGAGLAADIALVANLFFLIGALASLNAALTLPGIAGIILTIGMSVDANVLIFERVKEELRNGAGMQAALKKGYNKAYSAIVDANVTTLLTAIILFVLGSGPIKGFATTLIIGIFTSLFSAIFITRLIFSWRSDRKKSISFFWNYSRDLFSNTKFNFVKKRKAFYALSGLLVAAGLVSLIGFNGLDLGVDFDGGRKYTIEFNDEIDDNGIETVRNQLGIAFTEGGVVQQPTVKTVGASGRMLEITTKYLISDDSEDVDEKVDAALKSGLDGLFGGFNEDNLESRKVDPTISDGFKSQSRTAVLLSLLIIFIYIALRFRRWQYGLGALIAMAHDVLIVLGLFSIGYKFFPFSMEIDQAFIAAILTVVGYSINDTVVVFDRIREYLAEHKRGDAHMVVNQALNSTLSRTLNTSVSTFIVLLIIFMFGSASIKGFTFALMVGVVVGTYSSLFIATPIVVDFTSNLFKKNS